MVIHFIIPILLSYMIYQNRVAVCGSFPCFCELGVCFLKARHISNRKVSRFTTPRSRSFKFGYVKIARRCRTSVHLIMIISNISLHIIVVLCSGFAGVIDDEIVVTIVECISANTRRSGRLKRYRSQGRAADKCTRTDTLHVLRNSNTRQTAP